MLSFTDPVIQTKTSYYALLTSLNTTYTEKLSEYLDYLTRKFYFY